MRSPLPIPCLSHHTEMVLMAPPLRLLRVLPGHSSGPTLVAGQGWGREAAPRCLTVVTVT